MSAFGDGIEIMSVVNHETLEIFSAAVRYGWDGNKRLYRWNTADVTAVKPATVVDGKIQPARLLYPSRQASIVEMAQMARFADYSRHDGNAMAQLRSYIYAGVYLLNQPAPVRMASAA